MDSALQRLGNRLSGLAQRYVPQPFVLALVLTTASLVLGLFHTGFDTERVLRAWWDGDGSGRGFWSLLGFGMQMCLILVTGHALATSPPAARALHGLAGWCRSPAPAVVLVAVGAMLLAWLNWGLGLIGGALLAREAAQHLQRRGVCVHYPLLAAAGYTGLLVWHGGLSGSAPLKVTLQADQVEVLGPALAAQVGPLPLAQTVATASNLLVNLGLLVVVPWVLVRMLPPDGQGAPPPPRGDPEPSLPLSAPSAPADRLAESRVLVLVVSVPGLAVWLLVLARRGVGHLDPNMLNFAFLWLGLLLHGSARRYAAAVADATRGCAGIILQFPFYAGIMSVLAGTGMLELAANQLAAAGPERLPIAGFYLAGLVNLFVPSGGGQWAIQGPVLLQAATDLGVPPEKMVMALAYGDQWTNMLQPFWALPLLAITGVRARDIMAYTFVVLVVSQAVFLAGLLLPW